MGRRGWAFTIVIVLFVIMTVIIVIKSNDLGTTGNKHWKEELVKGKGNERIVQLFVNGVITANGGLSSRFDSDQFISQLDQALEDEAIKGVVIRVNSPGGEVVASDDIHSKIIEVQQSGKPVVVSMGATAASGGYYISASADRIFANPSTITGSLGVIFSIPNYQKTADMIGYKVTTITSGKYKDIGSSLRDMNEQEKGIFQSLVDESYLRFVEVIEQGRGLSREKVLDIADGRIYSGKQAKELGLIDEFGTLEDATLHAVELAGLEKAQIIRYKETFSFAAMFSGISMKNQSIVNQIMDEISPRLSAEPKLLYLFQ